MSALLRAIALALVAAGLCGGVAGAASPVPLTLAEAQREALIAHPQLKVASFDTEAANEGINIARSAYAPQVFGSAVTAFAKPDTRISAYLGGLTDPTILQRTGTGVLVDQYITDFGRTAAVVKSYEFAAKAQTERGSFTRLQVLLAVTQAYFEVLRANALVRVAEKTLAVRRTLLHQIDVLQKAGLRSTLDASIAQRDVAQAQQMLVEAGARSKDAMSSFAQTMGAPAGQEYSLVDIRTVPDIPRSVGPLIDEMLADNPELAAMKSQAQAEQSSALAVRKETDPVVTGYGYFGGTPIRAANQQINAAYAAAGVSLVVPIANGGLLKAEARQAEDVAQAAQSEVRDTQLKLLADTQTAYQDVVSARSNIAATDQIVATARTSYALTAARYRIGLNSIVDLSQAQLVETQAEIDRENAVYDYIEQGAGLEFVTGALTPAR